MIVIVDYGLGNLHSVEKAFKRVGSKAIISNKIDEIDSASKLVLPGVGHFKKGMEKLNNLNLLEVLDLKVIKQKIPILGICLGMQLMTSRSDEGDCKGLSWIDAETLKFDVKKVNNKKLRVPKIGWNEIKISRPSQILDGIQTKDSFYFVHSYYVKCKDNSNILSTTKYINEYVSSFNKDNIFGVQFHPEKSHNAGLKIIDNFSKLNV